ncbi:MAG: hypothetical protein GXO79_12390 [Chlorobi bacterium]|nr:hypothetical protein [Chlorobiota bacterium]
MKKLILFTLLAIFSISFYAQNTETEKKTKEEKQKIKDELREERRYNKELKKKEKNDRPKEVMTIMGRVDSHGGYAGLGINYLEVNKVDAISFNARGSWVIGHAFAFGIGGSGFVSDYTMNNAIGKNTSFQGGYGGIYFEPIILPRFPIHISLPIFMGVGGIAEIIDFTLQDNYETSIYEASSYLLFEPGAELEINFFRHFRIAAGAYYKYPATINFANTSILAEDILKGLSVGVSFKLGKF